MTASINLLSRSDIEDNELTDVVPADAKAYHSDDALTREEAERAVLAKLGAGHFVLSLSVYGWNDGIDGTLIVVKTGYSHS